jgi:hypothetical protein
MRPRHRHWGLRPADLRCCVLGPTNFDDRVLVRPCRMRTRLWRWEFRVYKHGMPGAHLTADSPAIRRTRTRLWRAPSRPPWRTSSLVAAAPAAGLHLHLRRPQVADTGLHPRFCLSGARGKLSVYQGARVECNWWAPHDALARCRLSSIDLDHHVVAIPQSPLCRLSQPSCRLVCGQGL